MWCRDHGKLELVHKSRIGFMYKNSSCSEVISGGWRRPEEFKCVFPITVTTDSLECEPKTVVRNGYTYECENPEPRNRDQKSCKSWCKLLPSIPQCKEVSRYPWWKPFKANKVKCIFAADATTKRCDLNQIEYPLGSGSFINCEVENRNEPSGGKECKAACTDKFALDYVQREKTSRVATVMGSSIDVTGNDELACTGTGELEEGQSYKGIAWSKDFSGRPEFAQCDLSITVLSSRNGSGRLSLVPEESCKATFGITDPSRTKVVDFTKHSGSQKLEFSNFANGLYSNDGFSGNFCSEQDVVLMKAWSEAVQVGVDLGRSLQDSKKVGQEDATITSAASTISVSSPTMIILSMLPLLVSSCM